MFVKNVSKDDIVDYNCGYGNIVTIKAGDTIELMDERAVKKLVYLLSPKVEIVKSMPKKEVRVEKKEVKVEKKEVKKVSRKKK